MTREELTHDEFATEAREDEIAREMEARRNARAAFYAMVREDYEPSPYDGTYSEM